jgi:NAD(P)-dependent dehydrogenase (short-subunit alcohol dehydrogenase family)
LIAESAHRKCSTISVWTDTENTQGLAQLTKQMAKDLRDDGINVNELAPGLFGSKMTAPLFATPELEAAALAALAAQSMGRSGGREDAAGIVIFFSSQAGEFVTGQTVVCDGGGVNAD